MTSQNPTNGDVIGLAIVVGFLCMMIGGAAGYSLGQSTNPFQTQCRTEDSVSCYWMADKRGNGDGQSFVVDASGRVWYLDISTSK